MIRIKIKVGKNNKSWKNNKGQKSIRDQTNKKG